MFLIARCQGAFEAELHLINRELFLLLGNLLGITRVVVHMVHHTIDGDERHLLEEVSLSFISVLVWVDPFSKVLSIRESLLSKRGVIEKLLYI